MAYPDVNYRYIMLQPNDTYYGGFDELNMDGDHTWPLQVAGRQLAIDALAAESENSVSNGKYVNVKGIMQEWIDNHETLV